MKLIGKQVALRDWKMKDLEAFEFWLTGKKRWMDFDAPYYTKPTAEELKKTTEAYRQKIENKDWVTPRKRLVIANKSSDSIMGTVSRYWQSKETNWLSIGIVIYDSKYWRKGIGREALGLWVDYLFKEMSDIARLDLRTWSGNEGMMELAAKMGFKEEARFRKARIVKGQYYDSIGFGLLRDEWEKL